MKKKVLHFILAYKIGGTAINSLRFIQASQDKYLHYSLGLEPTTPEDRIILEDFKNNVVKAFEVDVTKFSLNSLFKVLAVVKEVSPDIIHVNGKGGALYGFFAKIFYRNINMFYTFRGFHMPFGGGKKKLYVLFEKFFSSSINMCIAVSESERQYYLDEIKTKGENVVVIANGITVDRRELPIKVRKETDKYNINIITLSRMCYQKDIITMLKAFDLVQQNDVSLHIFGGYIRKNESQEKYKQEVDETYVKMKNRNRIYFWGDLPMACDIIHNFDIYWSTAVFEGLPSAIIEAMMSEILVVGTDCRGNIDLIIPRETGLLTKMKSVNDNYEQLNVAINLVREKAAGKMIGNAFRLSGGYSIENNVTRLDSLYMS
ncbi:glycosyltransferase [Desulforhopalus sp. IMCC35007]|uniref:glycosyltransferase n=1 Tax=Desulforhopalus sp. IMCC35007 TaxID=2569543 RepID=UPI0010AE0E20|nr:glycosyltransferase [Desulforhopalus sp. IMCC35007]TKB09917.1 glycosyltransferase family 4 protein [Desulforhopalus sp. IMCC35007]